MPVSSAEISELRAAHQARLQLGDVDNTLQALHTTAEVIGFMIHEMRGAGADQAEMLHDVELVLRAANVHGEDIRQARDVLARLGYGADLAKTMTGLARRVRPKRQRLRPRGLTAKPRR